MPGFYPALPESADTAPDRELRARAHRLAADIDPVVEDIRLRANHYEVTRAGLGVAFYALADQLRLLAQSLRHKANEQYPGPHPQPFRYYAELLRDQTRMLHDTHWSGDAVVIAGFRARLDQLDRDWPDLDVEYFNLERVQPPMDDGAMLIEALRCHWKNWTAPEEMAAPPANQSGGKGRRPKKRVAGVYDDARARHAVSRYSSKQECREARRLADRCTSIRPLRDAALRPRFAQGY
jgi:hypothetical protein